MDTLSRHLRTHQSEGLPQNSEHAEVELIQEAAASVIDMNVMLPESEQIERGYSAGALTADMLDPQPLMQDTMLDFTLPFSNLEYHWDDPNYLFGVLIGQQNTDFDPTFPPSGLPMSDHMATRATSAEEYPHEDDVSLDRGQSAMQHVKRAVGDLAARLSKEVEANAINAVYVQSCLNAFMSRFIPAMPVIHASTYSPGNCDHAMLLSMIVIGSVFVGGDRSAAKGEVLWRLGHAVLNTSWEDALKMKASEVSSSKIQLLVTSCFSITYAMLSGSNELRSVSHTTLGMGLRWARQAGMLSSVTSHKPWKHISPQTPPDQLEHIWKCWIADEVQRRALLGHYILDGLLTNFSGQPTVVRHTANPISLPCRNKLFDAASPQEWLREAEGEADTSLTFREVYSCMFDASETFATVPLTSLSIRVVLEALQSLIYEHHEAGGSAIGTPSKTAIAHALLQIQKHHISRLSTMQERVEHEIRWHVICIRLAVEAAGLARQICELYGFEQDLHDYELQETSMTNFIGWLDTSEARRALLHAFALARLAMDLSIGRVQCVHLSSAIYTTATIFAAGVVSAYRMRRRPIIALPLVEDWSGVWSSDAASHHDAVAQFISGEEVRSRGASVRVNLLDELNGLYLIMEQLRPFWGVTCRMSLILKQWLTLPTILPANRSG